MPFDIMEKVRIAAGLTVVEFTELLPIHRTTYYGWLRGRTKPDSLRLRLCVARITVLQALVAQKLLPVGANVPHRHRMEEIRNLLKRQKSNG